MYIAKEDGYFFTKGEFVIDFAIGRFHTLVLTNQNRVIGFGSNVGYALNDINLETVEIPFDLTASLNLEETDVVTRVYAGDFCSFIYTQQGKVYVFGDNSDGKLGVTEDENNPYILATEISSTITGESPFDLVRVMSFSNMSVFITEYDEFYIAGAYNSMFNLPNVGIIPAFEAVQLSQQMFTYEDELIDTFVPTKENYTFDGWYYDPFYTDPFEDTFMPGYDVVLYVKWIATDL